MEWLLGNSCEGKFHVGQRVETRGDMGRLRLKITKIHNNHYCTCRTWKFGTDRHFNMNCLKAVRK